LEAGDPAGGPAACAAVAVRSAAGRVLGVVAALDARARGWPADAGELLCDVAELARASLAERGAGEEIEGWRYRWLAEGDAGTVLLRGRVGGGTSEVPLVGAARGARPALPDASPLPLVGLDAAGSVTHWNAAAERELGWSAADVVGRPLPLVAPAQWDDFLAFLEEAARPGPAPRLELLGRRRDGATAEVSLTGTAFTGPGGEPQGVVAAIVDVTERRVMDREREQLLILEQAARARAELAERRASVLAYASELLHAAFDSAPEELRSIFASIAHLAVPTLADYCRIDLVQPDGSVQRAALVHTGATRPEPAGHHPADAPPGAHPAVRVIRGGEPLLVPEVAPAQLAELFAAPGERAAVPERIRSLLVVPLGARGRTVGALTLATAGSRRRYGRDDLVFALDLARRIALELDNVRLFREAETSARLRDEVLAVVSHDLRNPLAVVSFAAEALLRAWSGETERTAERRQLEGIALSAGRMRRLINDLLDVARVEAGRLAVAPVPVPVGRLLLDALEQHAPLAEEKAILTRVRIPAEAPPVLADPDRVLQVLSNLLGNAIRFTPRGGGITLAAEVDEREVRFSVADTGAGIEPEHLPHVFDRFWRAQRARRGGAGLGLAIARGLVEAHEGRIWAESVPGEGSTFTFTLPRADLDGGPPAAG
ncbi:MAG: ATP-binding protein, partial [Gemmatimonadota bacterium]